MRSGLHSLVLLFASAIVVCSVSYAQGREQAPAQQRPAASTVSPLPQVHPSKLDRPANQDRTLNSSRLQTSSKTAHTIPLPQRPNTHPRSNAKNAAKNPARTPASMSNHFSPRTNAPASDTHMLHNSRSVQSAAALHTNPSPNVVAHHRNPNPPTIGGLAKPSATNTAILDGTHAGRKR